MFSKASFGLRWGFQSGPKQGAMLVLRMWCCTQGACPSVSAKQPKAGRPGGSMRVGWKDGALPLLLLLLLPLLLFSFAAFCLVCFFSVTPHLEPATCAETSTNGAEKTFLLLILGVGYFVPAVGKVIKTVHHSDHRPVCLLCISI